MSDRETALTRARLITRWMDRRLVDPLLGFLFPGLGDMAGSLASLYLVWIGVRLRLPAVVIARMLLNIGIDELFSVVPLLGDLFDFAYRANVRNLALLEARHVERRATARDWLIVGGAVLFVVAALSVSVAALLWLGRYLIGSVRALSALPIHALPA